jgi:hypothetical protein
VTRIAVALAACLAGSQVVAGCASKSAAPPPHARYTEPRWQDAFEDPPEFLVVVRPKELKHDKVYGPLLRWGIERLREHSGVVSATPLEAIEDAEEVVIGMHPRTHGDEGAPPDLVMVVVGVRADLDPGVLVDAGGRPLWAPGPNGPVRELVRERDERGLPLAASLFELPGRTWIIVSGEARAHAREAFAHPFDRPGMDLDPEALAVVRIDGPALVGRFRALQTLGAHAAIGRRLRALTLRLPPGASGEVEVALAYADEDAAAFAEVTAREAIDAIARQKPEKLSWLAAATVDRGANRVTLKVPLPRSLIDVLLRAGSAGVDADVDIRPPDVSRGDRH